MDKIIEEMALDIMRVSSLPLEISGAIATDLVELGYRKQEWISVEDRLPINDYEKHWKYRNYYLVYTQPCEKMFVATYGYKNNDWWCDMNDFVLDEKNWSVVTHYMPLPQKPKMKGAE